jgi:hypothetical protein
VFVHGQDDSTAAEASIEDVIRRSSGSDALVTGVLRRVMRHGAVSRWRWITFTLPVTPGVLVRDTRSSVALPEIGGLIGRQARPDLVLRIVGRTLRGKRRELLRAAPPTIIGRSAVAPAPGGRCQGFVKDLWLCSLIVGYAQFAAKRFNATRAHRAEKKGARSTCRQQICQI